MPVIEEWLANNKRIEVDYPDITERIIDQLLAKFQPQELNSFDIAKKWEKELNS